VNGSKRRRSIVAGLLLGAVAVVSPAAAQQAQTLSPVTSVAPDVTGTIRSVVVRGNERLEPETVRSYIDLRPGDRYDRERGDVALKSLYATELFADVQIRFNDGELSIDVRENPVINRIILEGNKRLKEDKIREEIRLAPRQIFTRSKARADVARILELYRRSGRFGANVEPKIVQLDQNRVDVVFEMTEGPKSKVRQINIVGNKEFSDGRLRGEMATKQARWFKIFTSNDTYDPDRLAYDQQKMRQFYLTQGYADFRVVSAVAELTPDRRDFIVTYVVEEGERYKFGEIGLESQIRDIKADQFKVLINIKKDDWYNAKRVEDTVEGLTETAGLLGYAFADVRPSFDRDKEAKTMSVNFVINEAPRVYVERIDINGNTITKDKVIRREFRLAEGDAFNSIKVKRSKDRINSLGFFQEKFEIEQKPGSTPDKIILEANVEEKATGELQVSAGFSSLERFILNLSIRQRNFRGMGQELSAGINYSSYSKSIEAGFTEPYLFGRNLALAGTVFRRDYDDPSRLYNRDNVSQYSQVSTGFQIRTGIPLTEYWSASTRYGLSREVVDLNDTFFRDNDNPLDGIQADERNPANCTAGIYTCEAFGKYTISSLGYTLAFDNLDNRLRPSRGHRIVFNQDVAGVGGGVNYVRTRVNADKFWGLGKGFVFSVGGEAGHITGWKGEGVRLTDRYFLGEPQLRGFDIRGVGPRAIQRVVNADGTLQGGIRENTAYDIPLGGKAYYLGHIELELPLGSGGRELGLRPSIFADIGALWNPTAKRRGFTCIPDTSTAAVATPAGSKCPTTGVIEEYYGDTPKPRISVGAGINWNSPFGPFRIDIAKALTKVEGDDTQLFQFNVGTQF
jgi:outer membrane protein insertion porin family